MASPHSPTHKIYKPSPQAQLMSLSNQLERQIDEIRQCAALALGYHAAGQPDRMPETLKTLLNKVDVLSHRLKEIREIKPTVTALYRDLQSTKRKLSYQTDLEKNLKAANSKLKEHVHELQNTLFDDIDTDDNMPQTKPSNE